MDPSDALTPADRPDRAASTRLIKQIRGETLVALKLVYPAALQADALLRSLLALFPQLEWDHYRKDLAYLLEKGYLRQVWADQSGAPRHARWRQRWFRLTSAGVEVADRCIADPAVEL